MFPMVRPYQNLIALSGGLLEGISSGRQIDPIYPQIVKSTTVDLSQILQGQWVDFYAFMPVVTLVCSNLGKLADIHDFDYCQHYHFVSKFGQGTYMKSNSLQSQKVKTHKIGSWVLIRKQGFIVEQKSTCCLKDLMSQYLHTKCPGLKNFM